MAINISALRDVFMASVAALEKRERTPESRAELVAEYRAEAKRLRSTTGIGLYNQAGGTMNTHVAPPAELARRARERADKLECRARELAAIKGIYEPWMAYARR